MKKELSAACAVVVALAIAGSAFATPGKIVTYDGKKAGRVDFNGQAHLDARIKCSECHQTAGRDMPPPAFAMKSYETKMTMDDIRKGKFCGSCHRQGGSAFPIENCKKCHKK